MKYSVILMFASLTAVGCGGAKLQPQLIHGEVTVAGGKVETGQVRFVPIENTPGPTNAASIVDGQYRVEGRGGLLVGKYRVEVDAKKKTGRKTRGYTGTEMGMIDETVRIGPEVYAGPQSSLVIEVVAGSDGRIDIAIPVP